MYIFMHTHNYICIYMWVYIYIKTFLHVMPVYVFVNKAPNGMKEILQSYETSNKYLFLSLVFTVIPLIMNSLGIHGVVICNPLGVLL